MRIVVLDTDRSQTDLIAQVLTSAGHVCHGFQTGKDLLAQLRKDSYDMLIFDWQVPDMGGAELLRKARERLAENAPVMFLTTSSGESGRTVRIDIRVRRRWCASAGEGGGHSPRRQTSRWCRRLASRPGHPGT